MEDDEGLILSKMIYDSIKNKTFRSFIIIGDRDIGKSTYAIKSMYEAFLRLGFDEVTAWTKALACIKFDISSVIDFLNEGVEMYEKDKSKQPVLCWDDLRKFCSGLNYFLNKRLYLEISGLLDTIKIPISVFIGTAPSLEGVMNIIKSYDSYQINIGYSRRGGAYRVAKCYLWKTSPMAQKTLYHKWDDNFHCRLPNWVWNDYMVFRVRASKQSISAVASAYKKR